MTHEGISLTDKRRQYGDAVMDERDVLACPVAQFQVWLDAWFASENVEEIPMVLSTVDANQDPDSRVVLLKGVEKGCFVFYTNYTSSKAEQMTNHSRVALNFYWPTMARQIRVRGVVQKISAQRSDAYFQTRPVASQIGALVSHQSQVIANRAVLETAYTNACNAHQSSQKPIVRPAYWGGYEVTPDIMEFWQGRSNRVNDRIQYILQDGQWFHRRLSP